MNDTIAAEFIVEREEGGRDRPLQLTGWEDVVFELEDDHE